jgi:uncharacterized cupredoxin-like copper-binding protein
MHGKVDEHRFLGRKSHGSKRTFLGVLLGVVALVTAICAGTSTAVASSPAPAGPVATDGGSRLVVVKMVDFRLLQPSFLPPGRYTFRAVNLGRAPHALQINGAGVFNARTPVVQSGQAADLNVTLEHGIYDFWCPVANHRQMGMQLYVLVG